MLIQSAIKTSCFVTSGRRCWLPSQWYLPPCVTQVVVLLLVRISVCLDVLLGNIVQPDFDCAVVMAATLKPVTQRDLDGAKLHSCSELGTCFTDSIQALQALVSEPLQGLAT